MAVERIKKRLSRMTAGFLSYEIGWMKVLFGSKTEKVKEDGILSRNSKFSCDCSEFKVSVTFSYSTFSWIWRPGAQRRDVH